MKNRMPRKLKKAKKGNIIVYDLCLCPKHLKLSEVLDIYRKERLLLYDSGGHTDAIPPKVLGNVRGVRFKDLNNGE